MSRRYSCAGLTNGGRVAFGERGALRGLKGFAALGALVALAALAPLGAASAQDILIRGATVHTASDRGTLKDTDVLVRDGKISAIGTDLRAASGATVVEAKGRPLTPGLFGGLTGIGVEEITDEAATVDSKLGLGAPTWEQQWRPEFDVTLAYSPRTPLLPITRIEGVTWTVLSPISGDAILAGQGAAVTLDGSYDAVLAGSKTLFIRMGSAADAQSGGSRAAQYMFLDQAIREARERGPIGEGALLRPAGRETLARYLAGGRVVFELQRAADIRMLIAFARRVGMKPAISGGAEAWVVAEELAKANVPVLLDPMQNLPSDFDQVGSRFDNAALLRRAGVRIAFLCDYNDDASHNARKVRQCAGNAVAHGLPWEEALVAMTAAPADMFGVGATRGRVAAGQVADLVLWSGDPLEVTTVAEQVWIAGRAMEMKSRQTELRDRYLQP
jgi:hypothetical protein